MSQNPCYVHTVWVYIAQATGVSSLQRIVIDMHNQVATYCRGVIVDLNQQSTVGHVTITVDHLVAQSEFLGVFIRSSQVLNRCALDHVVLSSGGIQAQGQHRGFTLLDQQNTVFAELICKACGCANG